MTIDELIIRLVLKDEVSAKSATVSKTLKGLEEQGGKTSAGVEKLGKTAKATTATMGDLARGVASFLAVIGGTVAIKTFVSDMIDSSAALDRFSKNLGLSASEVTAWGNSVEELGGSAKGLQGSLATLSKAQTDLTITGDSQLLPYFSLMGVAIADAGGHARKTTDILKDMAGYAEGKDRTTMHNMFGSMGLDEGTINLLLQGRNELELNLKRQKEYGDQIAKFSPEATKMQRALVDLKQQFTLLGLGLLQQATPALEKVLGWFEKIAGWAQSHSQFILDFLKVMAVGLAALGLAALPLDPLILAITAVGAAIALLWDDYQTWQKGGKSLIDWSKWEPGIKLAIAGVKELGKALGVVVEAIGIVKKGLSGDTSGANQASSKLHDKIAGWLGIKPGAAPLAPKGGSIFDDLGITKASPTTYTPGAVSRAIAQAEGFNAKSKKPNRPQRNHNPGDIEYGPFAKAHGATGSDGRFAIFPDDATGYKALDALLTSKKYAGLTISQAIARFAPSNENDTKSYAARVMKDTGATATTTVAQAQAARSGTPGAANMLRGIPGASSMVAQAGAPRGGPSSTSNDSSTTVTTTIATLNINAPTGDGRDIANAFSRGMNPIFTSYANGGMN
jgi:hypothetical protein